MLDLKKYEDWRECIEVNCGIALTPQFISGRLTELNDRAHPKTKEFERLYGEEHLKRTIAWFQRAADEAGA